MGWSAASGRAGGDPEGGGPASGQSLTRRRRSRHRPPRCLQDEVKSQPARKGRPLTLSAGGRGPMPEAGRPDVPAPPPSPWPRGALSHAAGTARPAARPMARRVSSGGCLRVRAVGPGVWSGAVRESASAVACVRRRCGGSVVSRKRTSVEVCVLLQRQGRALAPVRPAGHAPWSSRLSWVAGQPPLPPVDGLQLADSVRACVRVHACRRCTVSVAGTSEAVPVMRLEQWRPGHRMCTASCARSHWRLVVVLVKFSAVGKPCAQ